MVTKQTINYDISFKEFSDWAANQSWLCVHYEERDFGEKYSSAPGYNTIDMGKCYFYLTPNGIKLIVIIKDDKVLDISSSLPNSD
jgi:hypothetical protein